MSDEEAQTPPESESEGAEESRRPRNVLEDVYCLFVRPSDLFAELTVANRGGVALALLLAIEILIGMAIVSTGISDYEIDAETQRETSRLLRDQEGLENEDVLDATLDSIEKWAVFKKLLVRLQIVLGPPGRTLAGVAVIGWTAFAVVALGGGKPKYEQLVGVVVYASFVEAPRLLLKLYLVTRLQAVRVETSLAALLEPGPGTEVWVYMLLRRLDPFEIWFWFLIGYGFWRIGQLGRRATILTTVSLALVCAVAASAIELPEVALLPKPPEEAVDSAF